jgi:biotin-dependent carboxylase-like uncharacterized protein
MDAASASMANMLLGNKSNDAVMEIAMMGPRLKFEQVTCIVISGAIMDAKINSVPINNNTVYDIAKGDILSFGSFKSGFRTYLAVKHGFKTEKILGSRSQYESVTEKHFLSKGDEIAILEFPFSKISGSNTRIQSNWFESNSLKVYKGPEFDLLDESQKKQLLDKKFTIAKENNRMAYQLNENLSSHKHSILTSSTLPGTVQLTPNGKLIILMKDAQTTGGYPRVLQLSEEAICILAQKRTNDEIVFHL